MTFTNAGDDLGVEALLVSRLPRVRIAGVQVNHVGAQLGRFADLLHDLGRRYWHVRCCLPLEQTFEEL